MAPIGGLPIVDVRDVAAVHGALIEAGRGPLRYMVGGTYIAFNDLIDSFGELMGRSIRFISLAGPALRPMVQLIDLFQRVLPCRLAINGRNLDLIRWAPRRDDSQAKEALGFEPRPIEETFADMVRWMYESGRLSEKAAGKLASGCLSRAAR